LEKIQKPPVNSKLPDGVVEYVFVRLKAIYSHFWISQFANEDEIIAAMQEWSKILVGFTFLQIECALNKCAKYYSKPPLVPDFYQILKAERGAYRDYKSLQNQAENPETAKKYLAELNEMERVLKLRIRNEKELI
jgi:hypothetical protein